MVAATQAMAQQARQSGQSAHAADLQLHKAEAHARQVTEDAARDLFERRIFDPYLRFGSAEEEAAYRKREAEREAAITKALDDGTPEGTLRANRLAIDQVKDAGAHGADRHPKYATLMNDLTSAQEPLREALDPHVTGPKEAKNTAPEELADVLAALRQAGVSGGTTENLGHGVTQHASIASQPNRSPA